VIITEIQFLKKKEIRKRKDCQHKKRNRFTFLNLDNRIKQIDQIKWEINKTVKSQFISQISEILMIIKELRNINFKDFLNLNKNNLRKRLNLMHSKQAKIRITTFLDKLKSLKSKGHKILKVNIVDLVALI